MNFILCFKASSSLTWYGHPHCWKQNECHYYVNIHYIAIEEGTLAILDFLINIWKNTRGIILKINISKSNSKGHAFSKRLFIMNHKIFVSWIRDHPISIIIVYVKKLLSSVCITKCIHVLLKQTSLKYLFYTMLIFNKLFIRIKHQNKDKVIKGLESFVNVVKYSKFKCRCRRLLNSLWEISFK